MRYGLRKRGHGWRRSRRQRLRRSPGERHARGRATAVAAVVGPVVTLLGPVDDAVAAVRRQLALRRTTSVRAVEEAIVALLGAVHDSVPTVRREDAARRAGSVVAVVQGRAVVA